LPDRQPLSRDRRNAKDRAVNTTICGPAGLMPKGNRPNYSNRRGSRRRSPKRARASLIWIIQKSACSIS